MGYCPICNGMDQLFIQCHNCTEMLVDNGRYFDYFGNYSPYMSIELMKESDGMETDQRDGDCPHIFTCENCYQDQVILVKEKT